MQRGILLFTIIASFCFAAPLLQANEDEVCDDQTGAAFGLCRAYYDAIHCQQEPADDQSTACAKIARDYERITGDDINSLNCPCFEEHDLDLLQDEFSSSGLETQCRQFEDSTRIDDAIAWRTGPGYTPHAEARSFAYLSEDYRVCYIYDYGDGDPGIEIENISELERRGCAYLLRKKYNETGFCDSGP